MAELQAIYTVIEFAWHNNIKKLWIESDSAISVHLITSQVPHLLIILLLF